MHELFQYLTESALGAGSSEVFHCVKTEIIQQLEPAMQPSVVL
jgi:hypothetical protein